MTIYETRYIIFVYSAVSGHTKVLPRYIYYTRLISTRMWLRIIEQNYAQE